MKNIVIIIVLLYANLAISQNKYPAPFELTYEVNGDPKTGELNRDHFQQSSFFITTQWSGYTPMLDALKFNSVQGSTGFDGEAYTAIPSYNSPNIYQTILENKIANWSRVFQYEPTLALDPNQPDELVIRSGDTTHPVFGFTYRRGRVLPDSTDPNFNRLIIDGGN
jgi:hypothetical protein